MNLVLLESLVDGIPTFVAGLLALLFLLGMLAAVLIMGSGRPHSK